MGACTCTMGQYYWALVAGLPCQSCRNCSHCMWNSTQSYQVCFKWGGNKIYEGYLAQQSYQDATYLPSNWPGLQSDANTCEWQKITLLRGLDTYDQCLSLHISFNSHGINESCVKWWNPNYHHDPNLVGVQPMDNQLIGQAQSWKACS